MTIDEIALKTGYSRATVARALSSKGYCSKEKREKVLQIAQKYGYQPNYSAKCLRSNKTNRILVCIPNLNNPFYFELISGLSETLADQGYHLMIFDSKEQLSRELECVNMLKQKYCDGLVLISLDFNEENIGAIRNVGLPVVLTNRYLDIRNDDNFDYVYLDHESATYKSTKLLIDNGCKRIALFIGKMQQQTSRERAQGYFSALTDSGLEVCSELVIDAEFKEKSAETAFDNLVDNGIAFDGIIAVSDLMATGIYHAAKRRDMVIGKDFKLVSFDNTDFTTLVTPNVTSIDMRQREIGINAANLMLERLGGRQESKTVVLDPSIIERDSSR